MRTLRFCHRVAEVAHFRVYVLYLLPTGRKLIQIERQTGLVRGEQEEWDIEPSRYTDGESRSLILAQRILVQRIVPDRNNTKRLGDLLESLGGGQAVDFLWIETAEPHPQNLFNIAKGAPEEVVSLRGPKDINGCFSIPLGTRPRGVRIRPT